MVQAEWNILPTSWPCVALVSPTAVIRRCKNEPACEHYGDGTVCFQFRADKLSSISRFGGLKHHLWGQCSSELTLMFGQAWVCFFFGQASSKGKPTGNQAIPSSMEGTGSVRSFRRERSTWYCTSVRGGMAPARTGRGLMSCRAPVPLGAGWGGGGNCEE